MRSHEPVTIDVGEEIDAVTRALRDLGAGFALVGGFAVSAHCDPRFTRDADFAVAVRDDAAAETLLRSLLAQGWALLATVEQERAGRLATARLTRTGPDGIVVDLLFASSGIEAEIVQAATDLRIFGARTVPVARPEHLVACKVLSHADDRPQDLQDLRALLPLVDVAAVRGLLRTIEARGYHRTRDLQDLLDGLLARFRPEG